MQSPQRRNYFEARLTYLQMQGIVEPINYLEEISFKELRNLLKETDKRLENLIPNYWQNMYTWYQGWGEAATGKKDHTILITGPEWEKIPLEDRAKGTLQRIERYFAGEMTK